MPYILEQITIQNSPLPAYKVLMNELFLPMNKAQALIDKKRLFQGEPPCLIASKNALVCGKIFLISYKTQEKGLSPILQTPDFAIFEKPSGVLTHPNGRNCTYSMCDEIWASFGKKASVAHRLDKGTSGLLLVGKNETSTKKLKDLFAKKLVQKSYLCFVKGLVYKPFCIKALMCKDDFLGVKMKVFYPSVYKQIPKGTKSSLSFFTPLRRYKNATLLKCVPFSGRQHQLRAHLAFAKHPILGDMLYGVDEKTAAAYLDKKIQAGCEEDLSGAKRLLLHANFLGFNYANRIFGVKSIKQEEFIENFKDK